MKMWGPANGLHLQLQISRPLLVATGIYIATTITIALIVSSNTAGKETIPRNVLVLLASIHRSRPAWQVLHHRQPRGYSFLDHALT